jgi:hypothetical protein
MTVGAYRVRGSLHAAPFIDALAALHRRGPMVPLTDAVIDYRIGDEWQRQRVGTLIVNRGAIDHIVETPEHDISVVDHVPSGFEALTTDLPAVLAGTGRIPDPTSSA